MWHTDTRRTDFREDRESQLATRLIALHAMRAERAYCLARVAFIVAIWARWILVAELPSGPELYSQLALEILVPAVTIVFSLSVLLGRRQHASLQLLAWSVALDALCCFTTLATNIVTPPERFDYVPILQRTDTYAWFVVIATSGLRIYPKMALLGGAMNTTLAFALIWLEKMKFGNGLYPRGLAFESLLLIYLAFTAIIAVVIAWRTLSLVESASRREFQYRQVKEVHHDVNNHVGVLGMSIASIIETLRGLDVAEANLAEMHKDLSRCTRSVCSMERMSEYVRMIGKGVRVREMPFAPVDAFAVVERTIDLIERKSPERCRFEVSGCTSATALMRGTGEELERAVMNLLLNAAEGDGRGAAARNVEVWMSRRDRKVRIAIIDDGPGIPKDILERGYGSTKERGSGYGMLIARDLVEAAGGTIRWEDGGLSAYGTTVSIWLQAAE